MRRPLILVSILFFSLLTLNFRCEKEPPVAFEHTFEIPVDIYPLKKAYSLTDTIWLETVVTGKFLFDTKTQQSLLADSGSITFRATYFAFGSSIKNPGNGFCDVISSPGAIADRELSITTTVAAVNNYGCGQPSYKIKVGFKPNYRGTYSLSLLKYILLLNCPNRVLRYNATISYRYKNVDLNMDVFNSLSYTDKGRSDGNKFHTDGIKNREEFVFKVE
jgi:hypothetical protein